MSGPSGSGVNHVAPKGARFADLVGSLRRKHEENSAESLPNNNQPSTGIPSTGLKRNTSGRREQTKQPNGKADVRRDSQSSSSSIPSNASGSSHEGSGQNLQEGAEGRGPGKHERKIGNGHDGDFTESPLDEEPSVHFGGQSKAPRDGKDSTRAEPALHGKHLKGSSRYGGESNGHAGESAGYWQKNASRKQESNGRGMESKIDPEEKLQGREEGRNRTLIDEVGRMPDGLPGVKQEEPPGTRNEIVLNPRISHINVSLLAFLSQLLVWLKDLHNSFISNESLQEKG